MENSIHHCMTLNTSSLHTDGESLGKVWTPENKSSVVTYMQNWLVLGTQLCVCVCVHMCVCVCNFTGLQTKKIHAEAKKPSASNHAGIVQAARAVRKPGPCAHNTNFCQLTWEQRNNILHRPHLILSKSWTLPENFWNKMEIFNLISTISNRKQCLLIDTCCLDCG